MRRNSESGAAEQHDRIVNFRIDAFTPRSIPVSFTVKVRQLDTERATLPK